jgi:hypothetical protein
MRKLALAVFAVAPLLFGCAGPNPPPGFAHEYTFVVKAIDGDAANVYLFSKRDEGDPANVMVAIERHMLKQLKARYGENVESALLGRTVHVQGKVRWGRMLAPRTDGPTPVHIHQLVVPSTVDEIELI